MGMPMKKLIIVLLLLLSPVSVNASLMLIEMGSNPVIADVWSNTFYLNDVVVTPTFTYSLRSPYPSGFADDIAYGWTVGTGTTSSAVFKPNALNNAWSTEPTAFTRYGFQSGTPITGSYATGSWTLHARLKCNTYYAQQGYLAFRLWQSANSDGSSATEITSGWEYSALVSWTAANQTQNITIAGSTISGFSVSNKYLFLEIEWTRYTSGGNTSARVYLGTNTTSDYLTSPTFTP